MIWHDMIWHGIAVHHLHHRHYTSITYKLAHELHSIPACVRTKVHIIVHDAALYFFMLNCITLHGMTRHGMAWHDMTWHDMTWHDITHTHTHIRYITSHHITLHDILNYTLYLIRYTLCILYSTWYITLHTFDTWMHTYAQQTKHTLQCIAFLTSYYNTSADPLGHRAFWATISPVP